MKLAIALVVSIILLICSAGFGAWAYMGREDYKNNVDKKIAEATAIAVQKAKTEKDNEFVEKEKNPLRTFKGPQAYGSFTLKYPKTWSNYVEEGPDEITLLLDPQYVQADSTAPPAHALKVQVVSQPYSETANQYDADVESGDAKAKPYSLPKRPKIVGLRIDGKVDEDHIGAAVILPLRDKTLTISTLNEDFVKDFDQIILKNFDFIP